jgi:hypothetical protein
MKFIVQDFQIAVLSLIKKLSITEFDLYFHQLCSKLKLTINYLVSIDYGESITNFLAISVHF